MKKYLLLLLLPLLSYGNIGKITVLKGDVTIKRGSAVIVAKSGTTLEKKDFIKTAKNAKIQIIFSDHTIFTIGKSSTLDIADYLYDESKPKNNKVKLNVFKGAFSSITGRIGKLNKSKFKLRTKSASIGIRGTVVKANQDTIMCTSGAITVTTLNGVSVDVNAGYKTDISSGTPTQAQAIAKNDVKKLDVDVDSSDVSDKVQSDVSSDNIKSAVVNTRNITLEGRTIDPTTSKQQAVNIKVDNLTGDLKLDKSSNMVMEDIDGNDISSSSDDSVVWGHWADNKDKKWVAGQTTPTSVLDKVQNSTTVTNASYKGKVLGSVNGNDAIKNDASNNVDMNFQLGGNKNTMDGNIKFDTTTGKSWNSNFKGTTSGSSFTTSNGGSVGGTGSGNTIKSGSVDGSFYGDKAQSVGGTFKLNTDSDTANGVFKATK